VTDQHELGRLRRAAVDGFDRAVFSELMKRGGEYAYSPPNDITKLQFDRIVAGLSSLANRGLIAVDEARSTFSCWVLKLTDNGRAVCAQLEKMDAKPRVEVQMHGDMPEVIKP
jgi:hypothetical protein